MTDLVRLNAFKLGFSWRIVPKQYFGSHFGPNHQILELKVSLEPYEKTALDRPMTY